MVLARLFWHDSILSHYADRALRPRRCVSRLTSIKKRGVGKGGKLWEPHENFHALKEEAFHPLMDVKSHRLKMQKLSPQNACICSCRSTLHSLETDATPLKKSGGTRKLVHLNIDDARRPGVESQTVAMVHPPFTVSIWRELNIIKGRRG